MANLFSFFLIYYINCEFSANSELFQWNIPYRHERRPAVSFCACQSHQSRPRRSCISTHATIYSRIIYTRKLPTRSNKKQLTLCSQRFEFKLFCTHRLQLRVGQPKLIMHLQHRRYENPPRTRDTSPQTYI